MVDSYSGRTYGYDQTGSVDPYFDIERTRFSIDPSAIKNVNTPINTHIYKRPYEQMAINQKCQELLLDLRNNEEELGKLRTELQGLREEQTTPKSGESFLGGLSKNDNITLLYVLIFAMIILIILCQNIYQQNNEIIRLMLIYLNQSKPPS